jgi:hypothetical protein
LFVMFVVGPAVVFVPVWIMEWQERRANARWYRSEYIRLREENLMLQRSVAKLAPPF